MIKSIEYIKVGQIVSTDRGFYKITGKHVSGAIIVYLEPDNSGENLTEAGGECLLTWSELRRDLHAKHVYFEG